MKQLFYIHLLSLLHVIYAEDEVGQGCKSNKDCLKHAP